jgi:hypothetical protein
VDFEVKRPTLERFRDRFPSKMPGASDILKKIIKRLIGGSSWIIFIQKIVFSILLVFYWELSRHILPPIIYHSVLKKETTAGGLRTTSIPWGKTNEKSSASRGIHNMLSHSGTLTVGASTSLADAGARGIARAKARQNGGTENRSEVNNANDSSISFNGNSFYIRSENDIHRLSSEIAALTRQQQRSMGST